MLKSLKLFPGSAKDTIEAFRQDPTGLDVKNPEANGCEYKSHSIDRQHAGEVA